MPRFFRRLFRSRALGAAIIKQPEIDFSLMPDGPFVAIGDIHGRADLMHDLLSRVDPKSCKRIVFLGDYVDRGPQSAQVLAHLHKTSRQRDAQVICLKGNHEQMMLDFIDDPLGQGALWLMNGGINTLESYGIKIPAQSDDLVAVSDALEAAMPQGLLDWLRALPLRWQSGNVWCVHAGMDPNAPPTSQRSHVMIWGHPSFLNTPRHDGTWVIHGHTICRKPFIGASRICIDTGAYRSDQLTAACISTGECSFVAT